jgi:adenosine deaminase
VRVLEDPNVAALARERNVAFEVCVTSNLQSGVIQQMTDHPVQAMLAYPLNVTINTDDPAVSDITLTDEYEVLTDDLGLSDEVLRQSILTAARHSFLPANQRERLVEQFKAELGLNGA